MTTQLPETFIEKTRQLMGEELFSRYLRSFEEEAPVSIRLNPKKVKDGRWKVDGECVPWCRDGYYLNHRPNFTLDPLLHAGCYYVQEAASMFLDHIIRSTLRSAPPLRSSKNRQPSTILDLCAAPGGKSTLAIAAVAEGSTLHSNEPVPLRASILAENIQKWGYEDCMVTNNYPRDISATGRQYDVILCDVPCSGEGMFRKDPATIREWSPQNVERCAQLQREIVAEAWKCLKGGGLLVYSTCTFNTLENEENVRWILDNFDAEAITIDTKPEWNITGSLLKDFDAPVYRFIPGVSRGEGLFMCAIRKHGDDAQPSKKKKNKGKDELKIVCQTPSSSAPQEPLPRIDVDYAQAIAYLRREAITLPEDAPRGIVEISFMGYPLGQAKNIGNRANNLYPKEWRIKTTHIPDEYEAILRPA